MALNVQTPNVKFRATATITDNWYAVREAMSCRLLAVGTWLPPECVGIDVTRVEFSEVGTLLNLLADRARGSNVVGTFELGSV